METSGLRSEPGAGENDPSTISGASTDKRNTKIVIDQKDKPCFDFGTCFKLAKNYPDNPPSPFVKFWIQTVGMIISIDK